MAHSCETYKVFSKVISPNPAEYPWVCSMCGKAGMTMVGSNIMKETSEVYSWLRKKNIKSPLIMGKIPEIPGVTIRG